VALPPDNDGMERIPLAEERVRIATQEAVQGTLKVHLTTEEVEETLRATLRGRRATVERIPIGRDIEEAPAVRQEGDVIVVPVVEEVLVVERRLHLREELHLRLETTEEEVAVPVRRRVQHADIRRDGTPVDGPTETPTPENAP
jgi:stress response protein YsnF